MRPQPMICVNDVETSSQWYQATLGLVSGHGGPDYERLMFDGQIALQLHRWEVDAHPLLGTPAKDAAGAAIWFETRDFDAAMARVQASQATIVDGPMVNPNAQHREVWLRDLDGYIVVIAGQHGDVG